MSSSICRSMVSNAACASIKRVRLFKRFLSHTVKCCMDSLDVFPHMKAVLSMQHHISNCHCNSFSIKKMHCHSFPVLHDAISTVSTHESHLVNTISKPSMTYVLYS